MSRTWRDMQGRLDPCWHHTNIVGNLSLPCHALFWLCCWHFSWATMVGGILKHVGIAEVLYACTASMHRCQLDVCVCYQLPHQGVQAVDDMQALSRAPGQAVCSSEAAVRRQ